MPQPSEAELVRRIESNFGSLYRAARRRAKPSFAQSKLATDVFELLDSRANERSSSTDSDKSRLCAELFRQSLQVERRRVIGYTKPSVLLFWGYLAKMFVPHQQLHEFVDVIKVGWRCCFRCMQAVLSKSHAFECPVCRTKTCPRTHQAVQAIPASRQTAQTPKRSRRHNRMRVWAVWKTSAPRTAALLTAAPPWRASTPWPAALWAAHRR